MARKTRMPEITKKHKRLVYDQFMKCLEDRIGLYAHDIDEVGDMDVPGGFDKKTERYDDVLIDVYRDAMRARSEALAEVVMKFTKGLKKEWTK